MSSTHADSLPVAAAAAPDEALSVEGVTKVYPRRLGRAEVVAVRDVSFRLGRGEILALLGPNGAGKTTTIKMIAGLLLPTGGQIRIGGVDVAREREHAVRRLGAVLEGNRNLHWKLTVGENLAYFGALKGVKDLKARSESLVEQLDLGDHRKKRVGELSRGLQQRVAIAIALINDPEVLLLDEPTLGLDVVAATSFQQTVRTIALSGCGIVLTTHQMEVAQALAQRVAIITGGRMASLDSLGQLLSAHRTPGYGLEVRGELGPSARAVLSALGAHDFEEEGSRSRFLLPEGTPELLYRAMEPLREAGLELLSVRQQEVDLEEVYRRVVGGVS